MTGGIIVQYTFPLSIPTQDLKKAPDGTLIMLHACAHNPTGCDPSPLQWDELSKLAKEKNFIIFFDCAYQGFASGDADTDAYSIRKFVADGHNIILDKVLVRHLGTVKRVHVSIGLSGARF